MQRNSIIGLKIAGVLITLLITACASMPIASMWKLRNLDMLTVEPRDLRIAVITNKLVQLQDGSTSITLSFSSEQAEHNFAYHLVTTIDRNAMPLNLLDEVEDGEVITLFYLAKSEAEKLRLAQSRILAIREQSAEGAGSMSIDINTGCFSSPPPKALPTDIFAQFDRTQGPIEMQSNLDLMEETRQAGKSFWAVCEADAV